MAFKGIEEETSNDNIDTLLDRLTADRASNLDNLTVSLNAVVAAIKKCRGTVYFVDFVAGDDDNAGTEPDAPKATFNGANGITSVWDVNDVIIASDVFDDEHVVIDKEGVSILGFPSGGPGNSGGSMTNGLTFEIAARSVEIGFFYAEWFEGPVSTPLVKVGHVAGFYYYIHDILIDSWTSNNNHIIFLDMGEGTLENIRIVSCDAGTGDGIFIRQCAQNVILKNILISGCTLANGIRVIGTTGGCPNRHISLSKSQIVHNTVTGAGFNIADAGAEMTLIDQDCIIDGNTVDIIDAGTNSIIMCAPRTKIGMAPYIVGLDYREVDLTTTAGNKTYASRTVADAELFRSKNGSDSEVSQVLLVAEVSYIDDSGSANGLDLSTGTHNQWQINIGGSGLDDCPFMIGGTASGQQASGDFEVPAYGGGSVTLIADISDLTSSTIKEDISQSILLQLTNGRALGNNLRLKVSTMLRIYYNGRAGL